MNPDAIRSRVNEFQSVLHTPEVDSLAMRTSSWAVQKKLFGDSTLDTPHVRAVVVASVYAHLCCPTTANAHQLDVAARFCLLFFCIDDAEPEELPDLTTADELWSVGPLTAPLRAWLAETDEVAQAPRIVRDSFTRNFHDYLEFRRAEPSSRQEALNVTEHWDFRRQTVFIEPYIDLWMMTMALDADSLTGDDVARCRRQVVDLVCLANDLGSLVRDRDGGDAEHDLNLVHTYQRENGWTEDQAVEHMVTEHNELVIEFRATIAAVCQRIATSDASGFADMLYGIVDGNRDALGVLHFRYPGVTSIIARLLTSRP
ncbi:MAG: terpene synthase family protein [Myxococcota bacterium]